MPQRITPCQMATLGEKPELGPHGRYPKAQYLCGLGLPETPTFQTYGITVNQSRPDELWRNPFFHFLLQKNCLISDINSRLDRLKQHFPDHESDHILNIAYNILCAGNRLEAI